MKTAIDTADELATKYAQCIWWTRIPILSRRDPRLGEGKTAPAAWCELCEEVYAELPNNKSPYISAAKSHSSSNHPGKETPMEPDQFNLVFNAVCFFISVAGAIVSGFFCFSTLKDSWEEKKEEKEKERELSANRDGDDLINPTDSEL